MLRALPRLWRGCDTPLALSLIHIWEKKPKKQPTDGEKKPKKKAPSITALDILDALPALFESLKAGLRKTRRRLRIDPLRIAVVLGGDDPADVGELYGMVSAAMYTVMPQLERLTYMPDPRIHLEADFTAAQTLAEGTVCLLYTSRCV